MNDFVFHTPTKVVFGKGTEDQVGALVKEQVQSVDAVFRCKGDVQGGEPQFGEAEGYAVEGYVRSDDCGQGGALV